MLFVTNAVFLLLIYCNILHTEGFKEEKTTDSKLESSGIHFSLIWEHFP